MSEQVKWCPFKSIFKKEKTSYALCDEIRCGFYTEGKYLHQTGCGISIIARNIALIEENQDEWSKERGSMIDAVNKIIKNWEKVSHEGDKEEK